MTFFRQQEVEEARDLVARAEVTVEELERYQNNTSSKTRQLENELASLQQLSEKLEREIILKRKTLEMLPSAADNIGTSSPLQVIHSSFHPSS